VTFAGIGVAHDGSPEADAALRAAEALALDLAAALTVLPASSNLASCHLPACIGSDLGQARVGCLSTACPQRRSLAERTA
jgi:hypothetical protein